MVAWFRKGIGITSASNAVSAWADQSGSGHNYGQATGSAQPQLQAGGTILFNGTSHNLTASITLSQPYTRYLRLKQVAWASGAYVFDGTTLNTGVLQQNSVSPKLAIYAGSAVVGLNAALAVGTFGSLGVVFNGASSSLNINGTTTTGNPGASGIAGLVLGSGGGNSGYSNIEVAEEIVYSVAHDAATQAQVIAYLNTL